MLPDEQGPHADRTSSPCKCYMEGMHKLVAVSLQAWPKEDENTKDEEAVLSGKTRSRRQPKEELSDEVRYSVLPPPCHRGVFKHMTRV